MKKLVLFVVLYSGFFSAQILTHNFNQPNVGDIQKNVFTTTYNSQHSQTGSGLSLDFSSLPNLGVANNLYLQPSVSESQTYYGSDLKFYNGFEHNFFYKTKTNGLDINGISASNYSINYNSKNGNYLNFPISFGYSNIDTLEGNFSIIGLPIIGSFTGLQKGTIQSFADAEGTIVFQYSSNNFLRLKTTQSITLYAQNDTGYSNPQGSITNTVYNYYISGKKYPVLTYMVITIVVNSIGYNQTLVQSQADYDMIVLSINEVSNTKLKIYPNPSNDFIRLDFPNNIKSAKIFSQNGEFVKEAKTKYIDIHALALGVYILVIEDNEGNVFHEQFIKK